MIHEPMHTCQFGGTASCIACYNETNAKKEYQKNLEHEPMHSCQQVTDEPCDACISEEEREEEVSHIDSTEKRNNILKRLRRIEEEEKEIFKENDYHYDRLLINEVRLTNFAEEKSQIIKSLL